MSLERVIADQQATIDSLKNQIERGNETLNTMWTQHNELFESFARLLDASLPKDDDFFKINSYRNLQHDCRMKMIQTGYCLTCYNFVCECEGQYD